MHIPCGGHETVIRVRHWRLTPLILPWWWGLTPLRHPVPILDHRSQVVSIRAPCHRFLTGRVKHLPIQTWATVAHIFSRIAENNQGRKMVLMWRVEIFKLGSAHTSVIDFGHTLLLISLYAFPLQQENTRAPGLIPLPVVRSQCEAVIFGVVRRVYVFDWDTWSYPALPRVWLN